MKRWVLIIGLGLALLAYWLVYRARRKSDYPTMALGAAASRMKTGDLILFSSRSVKPHGRAARLASTYVYRALYNSEWVHVGVVMRTSDDKLYLLHCDNPNAEHVDVFSGQPKNGVQAVSLLDKVRDYPGYCVWRPAARAMDNAVVYDFLRRTYPMVYEMTSDVVMRYIMPAECKECKGALTTTKEGMYCTEWVGALLEHTGSFSRNRPFQGTYLPVDFAHDRLCNYESEPSTYEYGYELDE